MTSAALIIQVEKNVAAEVFASDVLSSLAPRATFLLLRKFDFAERGICCCAALSKQQIPSTATSVSSVSTRVQAAEGMTVSEGSATWPMLPGCLSSQP
jgi:hypothetical protein